MSRNRIGARLRSGVVKLWDESTFSKPIGCEHLLQKYSYGQQYFTVEMKEHLRMHVCVFNQYDDNEFYYT